MISPVSKLRCPRCQSVLDVIEPGSGARIVAVSVFGTMVEASAKALETFQSVDAGPFIRCPACSASIDPSGPYRAIPLMNPRRLSPSTSNP